MLVNSFVSHFFPMKFLLVFLFFITTLAQADVDDDFLAARDAFRAGDADKLSILAHRLQHSPLEVYVAYYQLKLQLGTADAGVIKAYLARPEDTPLIDRMRAEWLRVLGKKQQWDLFDSEYPQLITEDTELICYALQSRMRSQRQGVMIEARELWLSSRDQPESCSVPFDAAIADGVISQQDIWQRLRLVLEAGNVTLAQSFADRLTGDRTVSSVALEHAMDNPARYLERAAYGSQGKRAVALFALQRLARQSPDLALAQWEKIASRFTDGERHYFYGWLGFEAARKHDERALQWFGQASQLNEQQSAWRVRAALRALDWHAVLSGVDAMTEAQRGEATWRYWRGRALQALGSHAEAVKLFVALSAEHTFYGQLAAEELADTPVISAIPPTYRPDRKDIEEIEHLPGVQRTLALYRMDLRNDALKEWAWVIRNFNDQELLTAAEIARRNEMYDRAINTAEKTVRVHDFSLRYLAPYRAAMRTHIRENSLEEAWVYGLMRQESRFVTSAKSGVGAAGLMQVMPTTARWIARKLGLKDYRESMLHQLDTNLTLGTYYMKNMLSSLDGSPVLASAAYNAGPGRARRWKADTPLEGAIYIETIPFDETRDYVKKVMSNTMYYAQEFGSTPRSLKLRVGIIAGKNSATTEEPASGMVP